MKTKKESVPQARTIKITQEIPCERIAEVLCGAVDPGHESISYWGEVRSKVAPTAWRIVGTPADNGKQYRHYWPLNPGGALIIRDNEADGAQYRLDYNSLKRGLQLMAKNYPEQFASILDENDDGDTSDILVQLSLFEDVLYS